jgi:hypothetical protein
MSPMTDTDPAGMRAAPVRKTPSSHRLGHCHMALKTARRRPRPRLTKESTVSTPIADAAANRRRQTRTGPDAQAADARPAPP